MRVHARVMAVSAAMLMVLGACGNDEDESSPATTPTAAASAAPSGAPTTAASGTGDSTGGVAAAEASVQAALTEPESIGVSVPLSKKPDPGKNIYFLQCGVGVCKAIGDEHEKAAKLLGWNFVRVDSGTTPEQIVAAWDTVLAAQPAPDAIITSGSPTVLYESQLAAAKQRGIPVVDYAAANQTGDNGIIFDVLPPADNTQRGVLMADWVAADTDGKATTLFLNVPDFPVLVIEQEAFEKRYAEVCDGCTIEIKDFSATDIGQSIPDAVVSYLQTSPDTNYVVASFDDMTLGVAEAIDAAGLGGQVKMAAQNGALHANDNIVNERVQVMSIPQGPGQVGFKAIDVLARHFNGESLEPAAENLLPIWIQTKETIPDVNQVWMGPPGYEDQFAELWLVK